MAKILLVNSKNYYEKDNKSTRKCKACWTYR